eukprot:CAMPEP_0175920948 /NCGR_PEP_ID=MMETSP0108-20121206/13200_1 /TAXON_ID=195067 ORGANISM="Goniomonas pacifica, Strain CCMP1869" /NCGR_SAMPLE_ID=MMETSP0108 /ASSEMBLY_ACC=CAM_ASM_000204 /LENGTH=138 /DNA_ID=CAMNT_0017243697 /DNA_START=70 /DNA_END=483 /DNA_ORIENTATION=-
MAAHATHLAMFSAVYFGFCDAVKRQRGEKRLYDAAAGGAMGGFAISFSGGPRALKGGTIFGGGVGLLLFYAERELVSKREEIVASTWRERESIAMTTAYRAAEGLKPLTQAQIDSMKMPGSWNPIKTNPFQVVSFEKW